MSSSRLHPLTKSLLSTCTKPRITSNIKHPSTPLGTRYFSSQPANKRIPDFAFAFDIDGVLLRSSTPIAHASHTLSALQQQSIPFLLLTNGGGKSETARIADLNAKFALHTPLTERSLVQSHTPLAELALPHGNPSYKTKTVLVLGGSHGSCRAVAREYGFETALTPGDIFAAYPAIWPFSAPFAQSYYARFAEPLPRAITSLKIDAVFVFNDPRDWGLDIQVLLDVMLSAGGVLGTYSPKNGDASLPNRGYLQDGQPPLYFSNPDLLWAAEWHLNRLGQGGFREAFEGVWRAVTHGAELKKIVIGKPHRETYEFAEKRLVKFREGMFGRDVPPLKRVYMIGDNPESDIRGANEFESRLGTEWISLLTRTGVYREESGRPAHEPRVIVDDVREAVNWALRDSGWEGMIERS